MKTVEIKGWIHAAVYSFKPDEPSFSFSPCEDMSFMNSAHSTYVMVMPQTLVVEIPDVQIDYRTVRVAALEKEREKVRADLGKRIKEINNEISRLQAIEFNPTEVVEG